MTAAIVSDAKALLAKLEAVFGPSVSTVETDAKAIGSSALTFIETNGLKDLYTIATSVLVGIAAGTPWTATLAAVVSQGEAAGITIAKGAEAVVVAQAQADLIAAGTLLPPVSSTTVATAAAPAAGA